MGRKTIVSCADGCVVADVFLCQSLFVQTGLTGGSLELIVAHTSTQFSRGLEVVPRGLEKLCHTLLRVEGEREEGVGEKEGRRVENEIEARYGSVLKKGVTQTQE